MRNCCHIWLIFMFRQQHYTTSGLNARKVWFSFWFFQTILLLVSLSLAQDDSPAIRRLRLRRPKPIQDISDPDGIAEGRPIPLRRIPQGKITFSMYHQLVSWRFNFQKKCKVYNKSFAIVWWCTFPSSFLLDMFKQFLKEMLLVPQWDKKGPKINIKVAWILRSK